MRLYWFLQQLSLVLPRCCLPVCSISSRQVTFIYYSFVLKFATLYAQEYFYHSVAGKLLCKLLSLGWKRVLFSHFFSLDTFSAIVYLILVLHLMPVLNHSHKKWKDSPEKWAKRSVLATYVENMATYIEIVAVENQATFFNVDQNINKWKGRAIRTVCELPFYLPMWLMSRFFLSSVKIQTCQVQVLSTKCCNSSKKQIRTISYTERRLN